MMVTRMTVFKEIIEELQRQDEQWGGHAHDCTHTRNEWLDFITGYTEKARQSTITLDSYHRRLVQIAALAIAACEAT